MTELSYPVIFLAGVISFLSPCVLPLVPPYLCYLTGATLDELQGERNHHLTRIAIARAVFFTLGLATIFVILGASATTLGLAMRRYSYELSLVAGLAIMLMGLHFLGLLRVPFLHQSKRLSGPSQASGPLSAYGMGLAFGFGWTPCIGPVLGVVLAYAATKDSALQGAGLLTLYAIGMGLPFIATAFAVGPMLSALQRFRPYLPWVEKITGLLLVLAGLGFMLGWHNSVANWLLDIFPDIVAYT
jgi:cytochrome c-type biogenesis protein